MMTQLCRRRTNRLLGHPDDARLLIVNADDFGMCHAVNEAILRTLRRGIVRSTTLMAPCPWALHAMHLLRQNPDIPFGVHLTVISEMDNYRWGPLTCKDKIPTLVDESGSFYSFERMAELLARVNLDELEVEFRAQIEMVLAAGLEPTHLDWHCLRLSRGKGIFDLMLGLAKEYRLALRTMRRPMIEKVQGQGLPCSDHDVLDSYGLDTDGKSARYAQLLRDLPIGLSEWAVHPGLDSAELRAIEPDGGHVRQTDSDFLMSHQARDIVQEEGIILLDYRALQDVWKAGLPA